MKRAPDGGNKSKQTDEEKRDLQLEKHDRADVKLLPWAKVTLGDMTMSTQSGLEI